MYLPRVTKLYIVPLDRVTDQYVLGPSLPSGTLLSLKTHLCSFFSFSIESLPSEVLLGWIRLTVTTVSVSVE